MCMCLLKIYKLFLLLVIQHGDLDVEGVHAIVGLPYLIST